MKSLKKIFAISGAVLMAASLAFTTACQPSDDVNPDDPNKGDNPTTQKYDPETRPLVMSISTPDGVFNPFFSTSAYDSSVISMTQISMLSANEKGEITYGDNEPVVVKDMRSTYDEAADRTTYEFIIKNGIKFSDGVPLTINDVLFNLYTYLDPVYTGSSTIYSTDIVGLNAYRTQKKDASNNTLSSFEESFVTEANIRIDNLVEYLKVFGTYSPSAGEARPVDRWEDSEKVQFQKDYVSVAKTYRDELYTDWNTTVGSMESYEDWHFTDAWQVFLLNDGQYTELLATDADGKYIKDSEGNYTLNTTAAAEQKELLDAYLEDNGYKAGDAEGTKEWAVDTVYSNCFLKAVDEKGKYDEKAFNEENIKATIKATPASSFEIIVKYWMTADTIRDQFTAEAKSAYFAGAAHEVPTISGIDGTGKTSYDYSGKKLDSEHSVLKITINGVDPKAIWNFAFNVAPLHYYSGTYTNSKGVTKDYVKSFDQTKGEFGIEYGDYNFMTKVINASNKVGLPVGGGVYMASTANGGAAKNGGEFFNLNKIYYERNPYFETLGSGINNAKIKYFQYSVVETDQIINSIATKEIDVGDPSATQDNIKKLNEASIKHEEIYTSGYGYVGINPRFVPNINIRRAIMKAMNTKIITDEYYQGNLAELIYRPMSTTSWAYPDGATVYTSKSGISYKFDDLGDEIEAIVKAEGYTLGPDGVYKKTIPGFGEDRLDYKFTIAGSSTDHPAHNMFLTAARILNDHGFAVKVVTSQTALSDLSTGKLEVWAAAWSSTIDPDMYQVYHMDSLATSVNNWGYKQIKANKTLYANEWAIIQELSEYIDSGRSVRADSLKEEQEIRKDIYKEALDLVMELAVEMPTYQRKDMTAYNSELINENTLTPKDKRSPYNGLFARLWEVNYN